ncbi:hypothetical protein [Citricoccus sp. GCM10030269]|uniref:hypothetical protein n=1 Tax=Citricoccus sp. GCM10030269 TaxID=3273388 RepID=UPI0036106A82
MVPVGLAPRLAFLALNQLLGTTTPPLRLTDDQRTTLYGAASFTVTIEDLRPGDVVAATDIDNHASTKEPVTITGISGDTTLELRYRNELVTGEARNGPSPRSPSWTAPTER